MTHSEQVENLIVEAENYLSERDLTRFREGFSSEDFQKILSQSIQTFLEYFSKYGVDLETDLYLKDIFFQKIRFDFYMKLNICTLEELLPILKFYDLELRKYRKKSGITSTQGSIFFQRRK